MAPGLARLSPLLPRPGSSDQQEAPCAANQASPLGTLPQTQCPGPSQSPRPPANLSPFKDLPVSGIPIPAAAPGHPTESHLSASSLLWVTPQQAELLREGPPSPTLPQYLLNPAGPDQSRGSGCAGSVHRPEKPACM